MILIFDLDETIYDELSFVKSGFKSVNIYLKNEFNLTDTYNDMLFFLEKDGRGNIFDNVLKKYNIYSKKNLKNCIKIYRYHKPNIKLYKDFERCLLKYKNYKKYIVTDGNKYVQRNKINALKLRNNIEKCYITRNYGIKYEKPNLYCFNIIRQRENCQYKEMIYIGDNPNKDFINLKKVGIETVRVNRGVYKDILFSDEYEANYKISSLDELSKIIKG